MASSPKRKAIHRQGAVVCCRARSGDGFGPQQRESDPDEDHKKLHAKYNAERAVHLIPLLLLACLLVLYIFSYPPIPGTMVLDADIEEMRFKEEAEPYFDMQEGSLPALTKNSVQGFSVYSHRRLRQIWQEEDEDRVGNNIGLIKISAGSHGHRKLRIPPTH